MSKKDTKNLRKALEDFEIERANKHLRKIFIIYLQSEHESLPVNFMEVLIDMEQLFDILDLMEKWGMPKMLSDE